MKCEAEYVFAGDICSGECKVCRAALVHAGHIGQTLVGYSSPIGHCHDDNCVSRQYVCANGHETFHSIRRTCPTCDWKGMIKCFCGSEKLDDWPKAKVMQPDTKWYVHVREAPK